MAKSHLFQLIFGLRSWDSWSHMILTRGLIWSGSEAGVTIGHHLVVGSREVSDPPVLVHRVLSHEPGGGLVIAGHCHGLETTLGLILDIIDGTPGVPSTILTIKFVES